MNTGDTGVTNIAQGFALNLLTLISHFWLIAYPVVQGTTVTCGCILAVHGVYKLIKTRFKVVHPLPPG